MSFLVVDYIFYVLFFVCGCVFLGYLLFELFGGGGGGGKAYLIRLFLKI